MTDLDRIREAIEALNSRWVGGAPPSDTDEAVVLDAARRYVLLAETSPDYEAAMERSKVVTGDIDGVSPGDVRSIVDAAVSKWLTDPGEDR